MRPRSWVYASIAFAGAMLFLVFVWLGLPSTGQARSLPQVEQTPTLADLDPRWLALVREAPPQRLAAAQIAAPTINIHLTDLYVAGRAATAATVAITVTRASSQIVRATVTTPVFVGDGFFYAAYLDWSTTPCLAGGGGSYYCLRAGDVVWVSQASATVSMTVPALSALADSTTDTVYGTAPLSQPVTVYVYPLATPDVSYTHTATADEAGYYQADFTPTDLRPRDSGYVVYAQAPDRRAYIRFVAPLLRAQVNGYLVSGFAAPRNTVAITVADAQGVLRNQGYLYASNDGSFSAWPSCDYGCTGRSLLPGDRITATAGGQSFAMTVLTVSAQADLASGQVWGQAPAGLPVEVLRFSGPLQSEYNLLWSTSPAEQTTVTATQSGQYTATLPLMRTDYGAALITSSEGNQTYTRFNVPYLWIYMGEDSPPPPYYYCAWGQVDDFAAPLTISIQGPSGYLKDLHHFTTAQNGFFNDTGCDRSLILNSGDVITLTTPRGVQAALTLPTLTAQADPISGTVFGLAPPGSRLTIYIYWWYPPAPVPTPTPTPPHVGGGTSGGFFYPPFTIGVTATAQGEYRADLSGLVGFTSYTFGDVQLTLPDGHTVARGFQVVQHCQQPYLESAQVGGNLLNVQGIYGCPAVSLVLRSAQGQIKAERTLNFPSTSNEQLTLYDGARPISIAPDDTVEIISGTEHASTTIPTLTVLLDPPANIISGQAPPGVTIQLSRASAASQWFTPTVTAQGTYSISLASQDGLRAGDHAQVVWVSEPTRFYADDIVPYLQAELYQSLLRGWLPPITPYTVSLETFRPIMAQNSGYATEVGSLWTYLPTLLPSDTVVVTTSRYVSRLTLPDLSANVDRAAARVYGQAPPNSRLQVDLYYFSVEYQQLYRSQIVTATATGVYTASFPDAAPLPTLRGRLTYFSNAGHQVNLDFVTNRYWDITLDSSCLSGEAGISNVPITVTLGAGDHITEEARATQTYLTSVFYVCFSAPVRPGDHLTLTHPTGILTFTVPSLTAQHNYARQTLEGQAFPASAILAAFQTNYWGWVYRETQADANGHYGLDTSDLYLLPQQSGYIVTTDGMGNSVRRNFIIQGYPIYLPLMARAP